MQRPTLWRAIGVNLALLTLMVTALDAGVTAVANRYADGGARAEMAATAAEIVAAELAGLPAARWPEVVERNRRAQSWSISAFDARGARVAGAEGVATARVQAALAARETQVGSDGGDIEAAAPVGGARREGVVRVALAAAGARGSWLPVAIHAVAGAALLVGFGLVLFRRTLVDPLAELRVGTERIARGAFGSQVPAAAVEELAALAGALNEMSTALAEYRARTAEDLRRLEAANDELRAAQEALVRSEKLASVGRLAAGLAHELGNPLAAVRGYAELLAQGGLSAEEVQRIAGRAHADAERMHGLLLDLLAFARQSSGETGPVSVPQLLAEAAATVRHQAAWKDIELRLDPAPATIRGDAGRLHQVLVNLLLNAADAGARSVLLANDGAGTIAVRDDGHGILPEHRARLFEPFFTTRPVGKGTGLGLAVAWQIVAQHGGRIEVDSEPGQGATFRLCFAGPGTSAGAGGSGEG